MTFRTFLSFFCILFVTGIAMAEGDAETTKIFPYNYHVKDLKNGLRVVVISTDYPNIVALQIPVQAGSRNEVEKGKSGFAHFFEHMMFRGTDRYPAAEYDEILKNAGADSNASTDDDVTNYHTTFSKEDLEKVLELEADRFKNLKYSVADLKTESKAVLGEYNKNSADPVEKVIEILRNAAFEKHTYKHTTMGFFKDIEDMPNQFEYSREFFNRYYRPEKTTIILAGDLDPEKTFKLVEKYWGDWERGNYSADIPQEPEPKGPVYEHLEWQTSTLPWIIVAFHGPAFSVTENDFGAMKILGQIGFGQSSDLYQKLVVDEQKVDQLTQYLPESIDPYLLTVMARVKNPADIWYVRDAILKTFAKFRLEPVSNQKLGHMKSHMKYSFAAGMDNSEAIAAALVPYFTKTRDPETINRVYNLYDNITASDILENAKKYLTDKRLVVVSLSHETLPASERAAGSIDEFAEMSKKAAPEIKTVLLRSGSPLVNFRILFNTGAAYDPEDKEGLAQLTAAMITDAGSKSMKYKEIQEALYPMAAGFNNQVDKEMTVFTGTIHVDNLNSYYEIISGQLLSPSWDEDDFTRVKTDLINSIKVDLRDNNEEELGKEALYEMIYENHPYGHLNQGHIKTVENLTIDDVKDFYLRNYTRANLTLGMAGNFSDSFLDRVKKDLGALPEGSAMKVQLPRPESIHGFEAKIIKKETRGNFVSFGFPIEVTRRDPDFAALWLVCSYLGEHRSSNGVLFNRIREVRGMNYGDYAYIEYFPRGMFQFYPDTNLGRGQQIFQIWIRPVESIENAHFATRVAMYELNKLIKEGISRKDFEATRTYLTKFVNILAKTQDRRLGYALDSDYYAIGEYTKTMADALGKLTLDDVNKVIKKYLQSENIKFIFITKDAEDLKNRLVNNSVSKMIYQADKPEALIEEDKIIENYKLDFKADKVHIVPVEEVFLK
jgi:zinc protease